MARKSNDYYYDVFVELVEFSCAAAEYLDQTLKSFDTKTLMERQEQMHKIEHSADLEKHEMMKKLVKEFITPIEREDIMMLVEKIDDVTDTIEDVQRNLYTFNIQAVRPEAIQFSDLILKCCEKLKMIMGDFSNFKKSTAIRQHIIQLNELEEDGDRLHFKAMRELYVTCKDPIEVMTWTEMFDCMEDCCDACENVSEVVESVMMKNS